MDYKLLSAFQLTKEERKLYFGSAGRQLDSIAFNVLQGNPSEGHFDAIRNIAGEFLQATDIQISSPRVIDKPFDQPGFEIQSFNATKIDEGRSQEFITFNEFKAVVSPHSVGLFSKPYPILWGLSHT